MKQLRIGVWAGMFFCIFSLYLLMKSYEFSYSSEIGPGPGFFPVWLCGFLFVLSLLYIYESTKREKDEDETLPDKHALKNVLFIIACLILFVIVVSYLGFILTGTLFLFILLFRQYKWYINMGISVGVSVCIFWLFSSVLGVMLPQGLIGF